MAIAFYGPPVVGGLAGWRSWGGWAGAIIGVFVGGVAELVIALLALPLTAVWRRRKS